MVLPCAKVQMQCKYKQSEGKSNLEILKRWEKHQFYTAFIKNISIVAALKKPTTLPAPTPGNVSNWNASSSWGSGGSGGGETNDDDGGWSQGPPASGSGWTSKSVLSLVWSILKLEESANYL